MEIQHFTVGEDIKIETHLSGSPHNPMVVFIPGLGANASQFDKQLTYFGSQYYALSLSLRGHGASTLPPEADVNDFALDALAQDVLGIMDQLDTASAHIVGNSTGGLVGYELLRQVSERVNTLTTFGTTAALHSGALGNVVVWMDRLLGPAVSAWLARQTVSKQRDVSAQVAEMIRTTPKASIVNLRHHLLDYDYLPTLAASHAVPLMLLRGEHDNEINRMLKDTLTLFDKHPRAEVIPIAAAGHFANLDQPDQFNNALASFLETFV